MNTTPQPATPHILNTSGYVFVPLADPEHCRVRLCQAAQQHDVLGTVVLSREGVNAFLAGPSADVRAFHACIEEVIDQPFSVRESWSHAPPFKRLRMRVKDEIITMGVPHIDPLQEQAPSITPSTFRRWCEQGHDDAGRPVRVLDTRNTYEHRLGKFEGAHTLNLQQFTQFPEAVRPLVTEAPQETVWLTYCTGGVRCEKAALSMKQQGALQVYQLQGGILSYLEHCGSALWSGECFVFDKRMAVNACLEETPTVQCHGCRHAVTLEEQRSADYQPPLRCPQCTITTQAQSPN